METNVAFSSLAISLKPAGMRSAVVSGTIHVAAVLILFGGLHHGGTIAAYKLPGTSTGVKLLTYYSPGSHDPGTSALPTKAVAEHKAKPVNPLPPMAAQPAMQPAEAARADRGSASAAQSGLGDGDIKIALQTYFPYPKPDLSSLPHGARGDVILNAVIDEHGKISELSLLHGLGAPVDDMVIATVKQWTYTPALKNGVPVPSEQELHFHYERS